MKQKQGIIERENCNEPKVEDVIMLWCPPIHEISGYCFYLIASVIAPYYSSSVSASFKDGNSISFTISYFPLFLSIKTLTA